MPPPVRFTRSDRLLDCRQHDPWLAAGRQFDKPRSITEMARDAAGHFQGEPRLPNPTHTGNGHKPRVRVRKLLDDELQLVDTPDQPVRRRGERRVSGTGHALSQTLGATSAPKP